MDPKRLRSQLKSRLKSLSRHVCYLSSQEVLTKIINHKIFLQSRNIGCYVPIDNEINSWPIIKSLWQLNKNCYLPAFAGSERSEKSEKNLLCFVKFSRGDRLFNVKYNVFSPQITPENTILPQNLDLAIVPVLGFNHNLFRLGHGAGYYDRTFAFKKQGVGCMHPYLIGVGYQFQCVEFNPNNWDVPMDEIVMD